VHGRSCTFVGLLLALGGCAHNTNAAPPPAAHSAPLDTQQLIRDVEEIRGLKATVPITVQELDENAFLQALHVRNKSGKHVEAARAIWLAFNFAGPKADPAKIFQDTADEQVIGFYDEKTKSLVIRSSASHAASVGDFGPEMILAHEVDHALQDQHFDLTHLDELDGDRYLAAAALVEGDATEVMIAYAARKKGLDPSLAMARGAKMLRALPVGVVLQLGGHSEKLLEAPPIVSERLLFPYFSGSLFVERFYQTGGFALVDRLYAQLPVSSAQILHPREYLSGTLPTPVATPAALAGYRVVASGELGEFGTSVLLAQKLRTANAKKTATGWRGDAFTIAEAPDGRLVCVWATTWANPGSAAAFEEGLRRVITGWTAIEPTKDLRWSLPAGAVVSGQGTTVLLVRGFPDTDTTAAFASLAGLVGSPPPAVPPLGTLVLAPEPKLPEDGANRVVNGRYFNDGLGVSANIPAGWVHQENKLVTLAIIDQANHTVGTLSFVPQPPDEHLREATFDGAIKSFSTTASGSPDLRVERTAMLDLGWGKAFSRTWKSESRKLTVRVLLIPACAGKATYLLMEVWAKPSGESDLDLWARSLDVGQAASSPACMQIHKTP
jgi:hypothetical protein